MKSWIARAARKVFRFFWSWGFLKFVLFTLTLIVLLYVEEDWRGARAWAATKAKWEATGASLDPKAYFPAQVPDALNLAALPVFDLEPDPKNNGLLSPMKLHRALDENQNGGDLPRIGEAPDKIRAGVAAAFARKFKDTVPPSDVLAQFEALYPVVGEIRAAAPARPYCRFNEDYATPSPWDRSMWLLTDQIGLSKKIAFHGSLALMERRPDVALEDIVLNLRLAEGVRRDPTLVGGLVAIGIVAIDRSLIDEGLTQRAWNDAQLTELQREVARLDFLTGYQRAMRGEIVTGELANLDYVKASHLAPIWSGAGVPDQNIVSPFRYWPAGWIDLNKAQIADFFIRQLAGVDPQARRVHPEVLRDLDLELQRDMVLPWRLAPWNLLFSVSTPALTNAQQKFAEIQAWLDEDRIVCGLERYRLANGKYPGKLNALAPSYIDGLPGDIMNGQPYRYRLNADGSFLLYSVGWNQTDEGGQAAYKKDSPNEVNYYEGDWPWPRSKANPR